jgi:hypothetical protein
MTEDLRYRAIHALEGSDGSPDALRSLAEYASSLMERYGALWQRTDEKMMRELVLLLDHLRESADPFGNSPYQMQIKRRGGAPGPKPDPQNQRRRTLSAIAAARDVDRMLEADEKMQPKKANSLAAAARRVSVSEIYKAREDPIYKHVDFSKLDKTLKDNGF